jgi:hypothetical protein
MPTCVSVEVMDFFLLSVGVRERFRLRVLSLTRDRSEVSSRGVEEPFKHFTLNAWQSHEILYLYFAVEYLGEFETKFEDILGF